MRIGIITFHWAVNYGAVLQAYALQKVLREKGFDAEVINYRPYLVNLKQVLLRIKKFDVQYFLKMINLNRFIKSNIKLSEKRYLTNKQLTKYCKNYDTYICGSDQIWNTSFTLKAEGKPTLSYYLNFAPDNKKRISYAASLGTDTLSNDVIKVIKPELEKFTSISVREFSGKKILDDIQLSNQLVLDPTLLLDIEYYDELISNSKTNHINQELFVYVIHENQVNADKICEYISDKLYGKRFINYGNSSIGIEDWINLIQKSEIVLTNSYHGMIFSIIYNKPFIVVPVEGVPMNNRIDTLLQLTGLQERLVQEFREEEVMNILGRKIEWEEVEKKLDFLKKESIYYLGKAILT